MPYKNKADRKYVSAADDPAKAEQLRAYGKAWRAANRNKRREKASEYYSANKVHIRALNKARPEAPDKPSTYECKVCHTVKPYTTDFFNYSTVHKWKLVYDCRECKAEDTADRVYLRQYGLTYMEAVAMKARGCDACGSHHRLAIDHCHDRGHVRGVLCMQCNTALGHLVNDPERIRKLAVYAEVHR